MALASLILSILGFLISMTFFKDLSLILSVLAVVLGIVSLIKKKGKVMCIISIIIAVLALIILFSEPSNSTTVTSNGNNSSSSQSSSTKNKEPEKTYGLNEEITINTGSKNYTLVLTGITETKERNEFSDKNFPQIFIIDYTYKNIGSEDSIYVSDMNFKIIDEQGEIGDTYPNSCTSPKEITEGVTCKAQMCMGVNNESNTIKLQYYDNMFNSKPDAVFEINLEK